MEYRRGVADCANRFDVLHVASFNRFKSNLNRHKRRQESAGQIAGEGDRGEPFAFNPPQSARLPTSRGHVEEPGLQLLALESKGLHRTHD